MSDWNESTANDFLWESEGASAAEAQPFRADTYEQLKLSEEQRALEIAKREKYEAQLPCLEAKLKLAEIERQTAAEKRATAEADRDRVRELRLLYRERRLRLKDRRKLVEAKQQTALVKRQAVGMVRDLAKDLKGYEDEAAHWSSKAMWAEYQLKLDPEAGELAKCPECEGHLGYAELGAPRSCSNCGYKPNS